MTRPIINVADVELEPRPAAFSPTGSTAERFDARLGLVGERIGARQLGCNVTAIPPDKRAFPFHNHHVNEELFFILDGQGEVRIGETVYPVRAGDVIACPAGNRATAHQIINNGDAELRFLAISTNRSPEICEYPDSDKFAITMQREGEPPLRFVGREQECLDYWEGE